MREAVEAEKQQLRDERKKERLEALRKRSSGFVTPSVPKTSFSNVGDVTRGQPSAQRRLTIPPPVVLPPPGIALDLWEDTTQFI